MLPCHDVSYVLLQSVSGVLCIHATSSFISQKVYPLLLLLVDSRSLIGAVESPGTLVPTIVYAYANLAYMSHLKVHSRMH